MENSIKQKNKIWLTKVRWKIYSGEITNLQSLETDSIKYIFPKGLLGDNLKIFADFLENEEKLDSLTPLDFCNFYLDNKIIFKIKYKICFKRNIKYNICSFLAVNWINKEIKKLT